MDQVSMHAYVISYWFQMATSRRAQRPLGSVRNSLTESTMPKFPSLKNSSPQSTENSLDGM